jgi:hypothetical protein
MALTNNVTVTGTGLYASNTLESIFLRTYPAYTTNTDPRLPKYDYLAGNLTNFANAEIIVSNISLFPDPSGITVNSTVTANSLLSNVLLVPVSSTSTITLGSQAVTANITTAANVSVVKIFSNSNILLQGSVGNATITSGETLYLYPKTAFIRTIRTTSSSITANTILLPLETLDNVYIGSVLSTANVAAEIDLPNLVKVSKIFSQNSVVQVSGLTGNVTFAAGEYIEFNSRPTVGAVRVRAEVIWYEKVWTANSTLTNLTRTVGGTTNSTISGNLTAGNLISILGLQTLSS